jgi:hypothetical protein
VRRSIELVLSRTAASGARLDETSAVACFDEAWDSLGVDEHAHKEMYQSIGRSLLADLSRQFPLSSTRFELEPDAPIILGGGKVAVRLNLVGTMVTADGRRIAIRVTTTDTATGKSLDRINWSALKDQRALLALSLATARSGADERLIVSLPRRAALKHDDSVQKGSLSRQVDAAEAEIHGFLDGTTSTASAQCGRCRVRLVCPGWLNLAVADASEA